VNFDSASTNSMDASAFRCPTCGARQGLSAECRRCKCDLHLVVDVYRQAAALRESCLRHLRDGNWRDALEAAAERHALSPDGVSRRLLAVSHLRAGEYHAALDLCDNSSGGLLF